jgi:SAM-dependent methyltransferase
MFSKIADNHQDGSLATRLRKKRFELFKSLLQSLDYPISILDIGGTEEFWRMMNFLPGREVNITLLNLEFLPYSGTGFRHIKGVAQSLPFENKSFDVIFSNSVIEHVGDIDEKKKMAREIKRVGRCYFIQTPNRNFPIEPHFVFPFYQFLPISTRAWLLSRFPLGWFPKAATYQDALREVRAIRLLDRKELVGLFQEADIYGETIFGLHKSYVAYAGWKKG